MLSTSLPYVVMYYYYPQSDSDTWTTAQAVTDWNTKPDGTGDQTYWHNGSDAVLPPGTGNVTISDDPCSVVADSVTINAGNLTGGALTLTPAGSDAITAGNAAHITCPIAGNAVFYGCTGSGSDTYAKANYTLSGNLTVTGNVTGDVTFNGVCTNAGNIAGTAIFNDTTINAGNISGDAIFNDSSTDNGNVIITQSVDLAGRTLRGGNWTIASGVTVVNTGALTIADPNVINNGVIDNYGTIDGSLAAGTVTNLVAAPTELDATLLSGNQVSLTWQEAGTSQTEFTIKRSADGGATYTTIGNAAGDATGFVDTDLNSGANYTYQVTATGNSAAATSCVINVPASTLDAPSGLTLTAAANTPSITLTWTGDDNASFFIDRATAGSPYACVGTVTAGNYIYTDQGLAANTKYYYQLVAYQSDGGLLAAISPPSAGNAATADFVPIDTTGFGDKGTALTSAGMVASYYMSNECGYFLPGVASRVFPDQNWVQHDARIAANDGDTSYIIDIEAIATSDPRVLEMVNWIHQAEPDLRVGIYMFAPSATDVGSATDAGPVWNLAHAVDFYCPCPYTIQADPAQWANAAITGLSDVDTNLGKPSYAFLQYQYDDDFGGTGSYGYSLLPDSFWRLELQTVRRYAQGAVIWSGSSYPPPAWIGNGSTASWWGNVTVPFLAAPSPDNPTLTAPGSLSAVAGNGAIQLNWQDNSPNADGVTVWRSSDGGNYTPVAMLLGNQTYYADIPYSAGNYAYEIKASSWQSEDTNGYNSTGDSDPSASSTATYTPAMHGFAFSGQPANTTAGKLIRTFGTNLLNWPFGVVIEDIYGNAVPSADGNVTLAVCSGPGTLEGSTTVQESAGAATFQYVKLTETGNYTLQATDDTYGLGSVVSDSFTITPDTASQLVFTTQPGNITAGDSMGSVVVAIEDQYGNVETTDDSSVTLAGPMGNVSVNAVDGVATFSDVPMPTQAGNYSLQASDGNDSLGNFPSASFSVSPGDAYKLAFTPEPSNVNFGDTMSLTVSVEDYDSNLVPTYNSGSVTLTLYGDSGTFGGNSSILTGNLSNGEATFTGVVITQVGNYRVASTSLGLQPVNSTAFQVFPDWLLASSQATWLPGAQGVFFTGTLTVTGAATIIDDPSGFQDYPIITGSGAQLLVDTQGGGDSTVALYALNGNLTLNVDMGSSGTVELGDPESTYNGYAGTINVSSGVLDLKAASGGALPPTSAVTIAGNGTLQVHSSQTLANVSGNGTVNVGRSGNLTVGSLTAAALVNDGLTSIDGNAIVGQLTGTGNLTVGNSTSDNTVQLAYASTPDSVANAQGWITIGNGSTLDVTDNELMLSQGNGNGSAALAAVQAYVAGGAITSSIISQGSPNQFAIGCADHSEIGSVPSGNVEVMFTLGGDTNLNGVVDFYDYSALQNYYNQTKCDWSQGDFNRDGIVNFQDYSILQNDYNQNVAGALSGLAITSGGAGSTQLRSRGNDQGAAIAGSSAAPTVTYTLSVNDDGTGHYCAGEYVVYASDTLDNGGIASYDLSLDGIETVTNYSPKGSYDDGTGCGTEDEIGFTTLRAGSNNATVTASQDTVGYAEGDGVMLVYGFGQTAGNLADSAAPGSTGADGSTTQAVFSSTPVLAKGTFTGSDPNLTGLFTATANVFATNSGYATEAATITFATQTLSPGN